MYSRRAVCTTSAGISRRRSARSRMGSWSAAKMRIGLVRVVAIRVTRKRCYRCNTVTQPYGLSIGSTKGTPKDIRCTRGQTIGLCAPMRLRSRGAGQPCVDIHWGPSAMCRWALQRRSAGHEGAGHGWGLRATAGGNASRTGGVCAAPDTSEQRFGSLGPPRSRPPYSLRRLRPFAASMRW